MSDRLTVAISAMMLARECLRGREDKRAIAREILDQALKELRDTAPPLTFPETRCASGLALARLHSEAEDP